MAEKLTLLLRSTAFRLLAYLLPIIALVTVAYAFVSFQTTREKLTRLAENDARRTSELIKSATHYGMLLHREEELHHTIRQLASSPGVSGIRVYDKQGKIIFSAAAEEIGRTVSSRAEACVDCHAEGLEGPAREAGGRLRQFQLEDGSRILGLITPIRNEPGCSSAACHAHRPEQTVLGVLDVQMSMSFMEEALESTRAQLLWATALMLTVVSFATALFIHRFVRRPAKRIWAATQRVAAGDLDTRIQIESDDELGRLAGAFNRMTDHLDAVRRERMTWSEQLERRVAEKTEELRSVQRQISHAEKMSSLGKLAASAAHELNNPLAGILNYAKLIDRQLRDETIPAKSRAELERYVDLVQKESLRCGNIVRNLLAFSRQSGVALASAHLDEIVQRSLMLIRHHLELEGIELLTKYLGAGDEIVCDAAQVQQALVALMINAIEAMAPKRGGTLGVRLDRGDGQFQVEISDTGVGMPPEISSQIFEPFFSTKSASGGVGLGLAVVYGIVQRHGYSIDVESAPGKGTTVRLRLPRHPRKDPSEGERPTSPA